MRSECKAEKATVMEWFEVTGTVYRRRLERR